MSQTLALGPLAACNRFEKRELSPDQVSSLSISECSSCNLVQLSQYPSVDFVRPHVPWIHYNEPNAHLSAAVGKMICLFHAAKVDVAMGVGPFDKPLLDQLVQCGFSVMQLDLSAHFPKQPKRYPYLETVQDLLRPHVLAEMASVQGTAKVVSCRYLLEHSHDPMASLHSLSCLVAEDGLVVVEIPDSSKFLGSLDYSFIWEEHICYFTEDTFRVCAQRAGYEIIQFNRYPNILEDALVFVLRAAKCVPNQKRANFRRKNTDAFSCYLAEFANVRRQYSGALQAITARGGKVAIFGAGHQSIMFINALGLAQHISCVIDDAPEKIGYLIPGTSIPIVPFEHLECDPRIEVCLLGVGPSIEEKIRIKCAPFRNRGGRMYTIFPGTGRETLVNRRLEKNVSDQEIT